MTNRNQMLINLLNKLEKVYKSELRQQPDNIFVSYYGKYYCLDCDKMMGNECENHYEHTKISILEIPGIIDFISWFNRKCYTLSKEEK